jgi:serine/threonine protein kinase
MIIFPGYRLVDVIHQGLKSSVYRAIRESDQTPVILKCLSPNADTPENRARFNNEYDIGSSIDSDRVVSCLALDQMDGRPVLVLADYGGQDAKTLAGEKGLGLVDV